MSEPTITNTLDEEMLASTPDAVFLHALVSIQYTVYGLLTYSVAQLETTIQETITAIDQYVTAGSMANTRTTEDGDVPLRKVNTLSDLHNSKRALVAKRSEAQTRIANRIGLINEAYDNLNTETPFTQAMWDKALFRLKAFYTAAYKEDYDRRYLVYLEALKAKTFVPPSTERSVTLTTVESTEPTVESDPGPFSLSGETFDITSDGTVATITMPNSLWAQLEYTVPDGGFISHSVSAPYIITTGYTATSKEIATGTCDISAGSATILTGDPVGGGLAVGDVFRIDDGSPYTDLYVQAILSSTEIVLTAPAGYGPYSGVDFTAYYRPELTVVLDDVAETWALDLGDITGHAVATTLNDQGPPWVATAVGGQIRIDGPEVGADHSLMVSGRSALAYGFPADGGDNWVGTDDNTAVEFEVDGTTITKTVSPGTYTGPDLLIPLAPALGENYTVGWDGSTVVITTTSTGPTAELHWVEGLELEQSWNYGSDVTVDAVIEVLLDKNVAAARGVGLNPTLVITATESIECAANPLGLTTTPAYGSRTVVDYPGITTGDTWDASTHYTWNGDYVDPPMPFSDSADVDVFYGGAASWEDTFNYLNGMHAANITAPDLSTRASLEKIKIFLQEFATGIGKYTKPVYPSVQYLLESLEEGQYTRLVQELVVFDLVKAIDMALIGRKDLDYVAEILPSREGDVGGTERGAVVQSVIAVSEDISSDTYFDLEDDPTSLEFPDSLVRY